MMTAAMHSGSKKRWVDGGDSARRMLQMVNACDTTIYLFSSYDRVISRSRNFKDCAGTWHSVETDPEETKERGKERKRQENKETRKERDREKARARKRVHTTRNTRIADWLNDGETGEHLAGR